MDKRFLNMFGLSEDQAISLLQTPVEQLTAPTEHYVAVSELANFPTERTIQALIHVIQHPNPDLYGRITRRKALESLGRLRAKIALPVIRDCLTDEDSYTVENAVWAIGEIGTQDAAILAMITHQLTQPQQSYRTIIQTLAKLNYTAALSTIARFVDAEDTAIASAAITARCRLTGDFEPMKTIVEFLQHPSVNVRRASIQDLIDAKYYAAIPNITRCPVSFAFRLRGVRLLANAAHTQNAIQFVEVEPYLDTVIRDHPDDLELVHEYSPPPTLEFVINDLYHTDFGRCYLASKTLLETYQDRAPAALKQTWEHEARSDYGAHYHVIKLYGWLQYSPAYDVLVEALENSMPQFQKSRTGAAIALGNLGEMRAIPSLKAGLSSTIFDLKYACLIALKQLGDSTSSAIIANDSDWLIRSKAAVCQGFLS